MIAECSIENCEICFNSSFCARCTSPYLNHHGKCTLDCPAGYQYATFTNSCEKQGKVPWFPVFIMSTTSCFALLHFQITHDTCFIFQWSALLESGHLGVNVLVEGRCAVINMVTWYACGPSFSILQCPQMDLTMNHLPTNSLVRN